MQILGGLFNYEHCSQEPCTWKLVFLSKVDNWELDSQQVSGVTCVSVCTDISVYTGVCVSANCCGRLVALLFLALTMNTHRAHMNVAWLPRL